MQATIYFSLVLPVFVSAAVTFSGLNISYVNAFLESCSINPSRISTDTKTAGGTALACAIFTSGRDDETVTAMNSSEYTIEREAHW